MKSPIEAWEHYFKSEARSHGRKILNEGKVSLSCPSETQAQAYIKASTSIKVICKSISIQSQTLTVDCNCPASKKGQFCKHIWAVLLKIEMSNPDFLESKKEIDKQTYAVTDLKKISPQQQTRAELNAALKAKQAAYRKQQYQKQKQRFKELNQEKKMSAKKVLRSLPQEVEDALAFFNQNGFPLANQLDEEQIRQAKKKLSQVFHPDVGGSHHEILELNKYSEILTRFLGV